MPLCPLDLLIVAVHVASWEALLSATLHPTPPHPSEKVRGKDHFGNSSLFFVDARGVRAGIGGTSEILTA